MDQVLDYIVAFVIFLSMMATVWDDAENPNIQLLTVVIQFLMIVALLY